MKGEDVFLKPKKHNKILSIVIITITLAVSSILYTESKPNSYEVRVGDKVVAYTKNDNNVFNIINEFENRFKGSRLEDSITVFSSRVSEDYLTDKSVLKDAIIQNSNIKVDAFSMLCDGKEIAVAASEDEGNKALNGVKDYYISKSKINAKEGKVKNKITYVKKKYTLSEVDTVDEVKKRIIYVNSKVKSPLVTVEFKGKTQSTETITPKTVVEISDDLSYGQTKVKSAGQSGKKSVIKQIAMENTKITSSKVVKERILDSAKDKVVLKGTKEKTAAVGVFFSPSRGIVSSNFGMRWGRMHEGLDIAANMGSTIYAALDGKVTYAGWATGYGNFIKLKHKNGIETYYGHCSKIEVKTGDNVKKGEEIGKVGSTGNSTGPHLHFEVRINGEPKDPKAYISIVN